MCGRSNKRGEEQQYEASTQGTGEMGEEDEYKQNTTASVEGAPTTDPYGRVET